MLGLGFALVYRAEKVLMIVQVARHGARAPMFNQLDFDWEEVRQLELNELLPVGSKQHYLSGLELSRKYPYLFEEIKPHEM